MSISEKLIALRKELPENITLVAVSKTHSADKVMEAYNAGQRDFGENRVQELVEKAQQLPEDIRWHLIGHLQSNKVKYIAPFVHLIHSVDSLALLAEIDKQGMKHKRIIPYLIQVHIATEESKFGFDPEEVQKLLRTGNLNTYFHTKLEGFMGMATLTNSEDQIKSEFLSLHQLFLNSNPGSPDFKTLSMGMSSDWKIAVACGSTMVRVGSSIFGSR